MCFIDSSFVEGEDYVIFFSEPAARAFQTQWRAENGLADDDAAQEVPAGAALQPSERFWVFNLKAEVSVGVFISFLRAVTVAISSSITVLFSSLPHSLTQNLRVWSRQCTSQLSRVEGQSANHGASAA